MVLRSVKSYTGVRAFSHPRRYGWFPYLAIPRLYAWGGGSFVRGMSKKVNGTYLPENVARALAKNYRPFELVGLRRRCCYVNCVL